MTRALVVKLLAGVFWVVACAAAFDLSFDPGRASEDGGIWILLAGLVAIFALDVWGWRAPHGRSGRKRRRRDEHSG
ncbi:MAG: hypothetical protein ACU85V_03665 [Gammaproteobacteria bacterium]